MNIKIQQFMLSFILRKTRDITEFSAGVTTFFLCGMPSSVVVSYLSCRVTKC